MVECEELYGVIRFEFAQPPDGRRRGRFLDTSGCQCLAKCLIVMHSPGLLIYYVNDERVINTWTALGKYVCSKKINK